MHATAKLARANVPGSWRVPVNMRAVNTRADGSCPMLSPDGRYLLFTRKGDILWVDASVIETLRPKPSAGSQHRKGRD